MTVNMLFSPIIFFCLFIVVVVIVLITKYPISLPRV